jgi:MFS family permease
MRSLTQSVYLIGGLFSLSSGFVSDKFGRKKTLLLLTFAMCLVYILSELAQVKILFNFSLLTRYAIYTLGQFVIGCLQKSLYCVGFILLIEMTSLKYLTIVSIYYLCMFVVGEFVLLFVGYVTRGDWHIINYFIIVYGCVCIIIIVVFVPESPR